LRNRFGAVDLIAQAPDEKTIVIVEVKAGQGEAGETGGSFAPELHVNTAKQRKLIALGAQIARDHKLQHRPLRFDVIGVDLPNNQTPTMRHHIAAFESHV
jgi:Holliday junction resolvase-like predicted endonuclease